MRHRLTRIVTATAMLGASLALTGGVLLATAGPASATVGNPCTTLVGTIDLGVPAFSGTLSGCQSHGGGTLSVPFVDISGGPSQGFVFWNTGKATTAFTVTALVGVGDCSASGLPIAATLTITANSGPYTPDVGGGVICTDGVTIVNAGPISV
jgi:hypothetical protein